MLLARRLRRLMAASLCMLLSTSTTALAQSNASDFSKWLDREWARASDPLSGDLVLQYSVTRHSVITPAEIDALRKEVAGHPDHPKLAQLQVEEQKLAGLVERWKVWARSDSQWRANSDLGNDLGYVDTVNTGDVQWLLTPKQLTIVDTNHPTAGTGFGSLAPTLRTDVGWFRFGGLHLGRKAGLKPMSIIQSSDNEFMVECRSDAGLSIDFKLHWDPSLGRAFVDLVTYRAVPNRPRAARVVKVSGWKSLPPSADWVAQLIQDSDQGKLERELQLETLSTFSTADFKELVQIPAFDGADAARGKVTVRSVYDHRPGKATATEISGGVRLSRPLELAGSDSSYLKWAGWGLIAFLGGALVFVKLRQRAAGNHH